VGMEVSPAIILHCAAELKFGATGRSAELKFGATGRSAELKVGATVARPN
jgi:hypothetical protein